MSWSTENGARRLMIGLSAAASLWMGCAGLPHPDAVDAERAQRRWPGTDLKALEAGRRAYAARCSGCHALYLPDSRPPEVWPKLVSEMAQEGSIRDDERVLIEQFLVTMAERARARSAGSPELPGR